jgi:hypothetical protein
MATDITANGGHGTVGIYNFAAEQHDYSNIEVRADTALAFVQTNVFGVTSPYRTFSSSGYSCGMLTIGGGGSTLASKNATTPAVYLDNALCVHFNNTYFQGSGHGDGTVNNRVIVAKYCLQVHVIGGNVEEANSIAYFENCTDVVLNVMCKARAFAPIEVGAGKSLTGLVFRPLVIGSTPYTAWPRYIEAGAGSTLTDTYINVPGDDATVSGSNCTDVRAYYRSVKRSNVGYGGIINQHLAGVPLVEEAVSFNPIPSGGRPNNSLFLDSADGIIKFKDSGGVVHALW